MGRLGLTPLQLPCVRAGVHFARSQKLAVIHNAISTFICLVHHLLDGIVVHVHSQASHGILQLLVVQESTAVGVKGQECLTNCFLEGQFRV